MSNFKTTAFGEAQYPYLMEADYMYKSEGLFQVKLVMTKEEAQPDIDVIDQVIAREVEEETKKNPSKEIKRAPLPYEFLEDGNVKFNFKLRASGVNKTTGKTFTQSPRVVDHNLDDLPEGTNVWSGSILRVNYEPIGYSVASTGVGATLRLKGVQIKKLVQGSLGGATGFDKVEPIISSLPGPTEGGF